ncbi:MAG TPA: hypothetical protein VH256_10060 [Thermoleophilaceae bacterium]|nr:hypothetical protein [Thermoleophilaceae bacterium]
MHVLVGVVGAALVLLVLAEFFVAFLLPRRVKRDPRIARQIYTVAWPVWRWVADRLPRRARDTMLGLFGPLGLIVMLGLWAFGVVVGYACLHWAGGSKLGPGGVEVTFGNDLYYSAGTFFSGTTNLAAHTTYAHVLNILEAATGFAILFIAIGYLPALFQAFSRREVAVSQLDPRAGSPPTAGALLLHSAGRGGWDDLDGYLEEWENWAAEVMETHLSYPVLGYFRSQHLNQNWLGALTTVLDTSAFTMVAGSEKASRTAQLTFAIGRHAIADLAFAFHTRTAPPSGDRLSEDALRELCEMLDEAGLELHGDGEMHAKLEELRDTYEPYARALSQRLALPLSEWLPPEELESNWQRASAQRRGRSLLP